MSGHIYAQTETNPRPSTWLKRNVDRIILDLIRLYAPYVSDEIIVLWPRREDDLMTICNVPASLMRLVVSNLDPSHYAPARLWLLQSLLDTLRMEELVLRTSSLAAVR